ncbi:hypothetical protein IPN35_05470 [Candidatus Peregrinibacteria bacterium]|nr:MAG: hypothetical protein IPN35_05470 [Candidatus Peregrinibacteria bacterium]
MQKIKIFFWQSFVVFLGIFIFLEKTYARGIPQENCPPEGCLAPPPSNGLVGEICTKGFRECVLVITNYFLGFVGLIAVVALVFFGFLWITAGGNDDQIDRGKKGIIWVALGIILILLSWAIVSFLVKWAQ